MTQGKLREESRFSGQAPAKQSDEVVARAKPAAIQLLVTLGINSAISQFVTDWKNEIAASLRSSQ
jgi:hypothetical protein